MSIARYYVPEKQESDTFFRFIPGVPLRDITDDEFLSYPDYIQASIDASDLYRKTKPADAAKPSRASEQKE